MKKLVIMIAMVGLFGVACSKQADKPVPQPLSETNRIIDPVKVSESSKATSALSAHENYALTLRKENLGQYFLLRTALIQSIPDPTGNHLAAKVVYFKKNGPTVGLFELTDGRYEQTAIPTEVLLATFPTIKEDETSVTIDFNKGMNKLFYGRSTFASDLSDGQDAEEEAVSISDSYVDRAEIKGDILYIDQFVRLSSIEEGRQYNFAMRVKYNLQSYVYNQEFPSKVSTFQNKVGFFETNPLIQPQTAQRIPLIAKWDINKPITFHLSRNTPAEMVQPLTDAVLYWNKVFKEVAGKEPLRVEMLPEGVDLYTPGYNIIQWMDNDVAGAAYADMEVDPLTGETLRANVYMPSIFANSAINDGYDNLLEMVANTNKEAKAHAHGPKVSLKNFSTAHVECNRHANEQIAQLAFQAKEMIADAEKSGVKIDIEAIIKRFRDDTVRETVAHEVGHTLGLRHNFAGSTYTTVNSTNHAQLFRMYFLTGNLVESQKLGSSLMDYNVPTFAAMIGANIRLGFTPLAYDLAAMKWGYTEVDADRMSFGPFCTDGHLMTGIYSDCKQFDQFRNPTEGNFYGFNEKIQKISFMFANAFGDILSNDQIADKTPYLKKVTLNPLSITRYIVNGLNATLATLSPVSQSVNVLAKFGSVNYYNQKDYLETTNAFKRQSIEAIGGLTKLALTDYTPVAKDNGITLPIVEKMRAIFDNNIKNLYGDALKDTEKAAINEAADRFFGAITTEILTTHAVLLNQVSFFEIDETFPAALQKHVDSVLFTKGKEELVRNQDGSVVVMKPLIDNVRTDGTDLRAQAVTAIIHNFFPADASYDFDRSQMAQELWTKYTNERNSILSNAQNANRKTLNWIRTEDKRFAPINPN